jgi:hypothetical protein
MMEAATGSSKWLAALHSPVRDIIQLAKTGQAAVQSGKPGTPKAGCFKGGHACICAKMMIECPLCLYLLYVRK